MQLFQLKLFPIIFRRFFCKYLLTNSIVFVLHSFQVRSNYQKIDIEWMNAYINFSSLYYRSMSFSEDIFLSLNGICSPSILDYAWENINSSTKSSMCSCSKDSLFINLMVLEDLCFKWNWSGDWRAKCDFLAYSFVGRDLLKNVWHNPCGLLGEEIK